jgi:hypothetical protein
MTVRRRVRMGVDLIAELDRHDENAPMPHPALGDHMIGERLTSRVRPFRTVTSITIALFAAAAISAREHATGVVKERMDTMESMRRV